MKQLLLLLLIASIFITGCRGLKDSPKYKFEDGVYVTKLNGQKQPVYIENTNDTIIVYALERGWKKLNVKASSLPKKSASPNAVHTVRSNRYEKSSFDIDFLTVAVKLRPEASGFPKQLNTNLNGMVYLGFRKDFYQLNYNKNPIGKISQKIVHYGISAGLVTGLGATAMNPWVTNNNINMEYDGIVWSKGVAVLMGVDRFTFGLVGAVDHLLDKNKTSWIYQGKPYLGLAIGLNLN